MSSEVILLAGLALVGWVQLLRGAEQDESPSRLREWQSKQVWDKERGLWVTVWRSRRPKPGHHFLDPNAHLFMEPWTDWAEWPRPSTTGKQHG